MKSFVYIIVTLFLICQNSKAQVCVDLFKGNSELAITSERPDTSLNNDYLKLRVLEREKDQFSVQDARGVFEMLNKIFFPVLIELHKQVMSLSRELIEELYQKVDRNIEVMPKTPQFVSFAARRRFPDRFINWLLFPEKVKTPNSSWVNEVPETWKVWRIEQASRIPMGAREELAYMMSNIVYNVKKNSSTFDFDNLTGQNQHFLWFHSSKNVVIKDADIFYMIFPLITGVGYYGEPFARAQIITTLILTHLSESNLKPFSKQLMRDFPDLIQEETARGNDVKGYGQKVKNLAPLVALSEGLLSNHQAVNALSMDKLPLDITADSVLTALTFNISAPNGGVTTQFGRNLPNGVIGPSSLQGKYFRNPIVTNENGDLVFNPEVSQKMRNIKAQYGAYQRQYPRAEGETCIACPLSSRNLNAKDGNNNDPPGLQILLITYEHVFKVVYEIINGG